VKTIISRDKARGSEFPNMQEVKGTLRSESSYQGLTMPTKEEDVRKIPAEHLANPEERTVEEVPYKKEQKCTKPISSLLSDPTSQSKILGVRTEESDPQTSHT
jgi:hypothetical protein